MEPSNLEIKPAPTCHEIVAECEKQFGLERGVLRSKNKSRQFVSVRHIAVYLCRKMTNKSLPQIARVIGYKDHTSALYACRVAPIVLEQDIDYAAKAAAVEDAFSA